MPKINQETGFERVQHIIGSGTGVLDFAVDGKDEYYTWEGSEEADWEVEDVERVENIEEDRFVMYPVGEYFVCEIESASEGGGVAGSRVRCWSR
jgi:hypothetical protein